MRIRPITTAVTMIAMLLIVTMISPLSAAVKPNILWIVTDDQRPDSIAAFNRIMHGGPDSVLGHVHSPNVDRLVSKGTTFINTYNQNPGCAPSRTCMHTGRYSHRTGVYGFEYYNPEGREFWKPMVPEILRDEAGYQTISVGKQGIRDRHFANKKRTGSNGPVLYQTDLGYRAEFAAKGLVEWNSETRWSGGQQGPKTDTFFLPDGTKLAWPGAAGATPDGRKAIRDRFDIFRDYRVAEAIAGDEDGGLGSILGGVNPKPGDQTRDANFAAAVLDHLDHAGQEYSDVLGRKQKGPDPEQPVFVHCGFEFPHTPVLPPAEFREKFAKLRYEIPKLTPEEFAGFPPQIARAFKNEGSDHFTDAEKQQMVSDYYAYCAYGDSLVGKLADGFIEFSEKHGRPWLILYVCGDNGWKLNHHGMVSKFLHYDHDLHNPIIVVSSDKEAFPSGKVVKDFTQFVDMAPTFLAAAGVDISKPEYKYLDGRDLAKTAAGSVRPRDYIISEPTWVVGPRAVIRTRDYKFSMRIRPHNGNAIVPSTSGKDVDWAIKADLKDVEPALFDLCADPGEIRNVALDPNYRFVVDALRTKLQNIVLGDGRVEVAWGKQGDGGGAQISNFAPGADDGRLEVPAIGKRNAALPSPDGMLHLVTAPAQKFAGRIFFLNDWDGGDKDNQNAGHELNRNSRIKEGVTILSDSPGNKPKKVEVADLVLDARILADASRQGKIAIAMGAHSRHALAWLTRLPKDAYKYGNITLVTHSNWNELDGRAGYDANKEPGDPELVDTHGESLRRGLYANLARISDLGVTILEIPRTDSGPGGWGGRIGNGDFDAAETKSYDISDLGLVHYLKTGITRATREQRNEFVSEASKKPSSSQDAKP